MTPDIPVLEPTAAADEVDAMSVLTDPDMLSDIVSDSEESRPNHLAGIAARKNALLEKQTQREAERRAKDEQQAQQTADARAKREEHNEKRRLEDDLLALDEDMAELDREFRRQHMAPRTVPIGTDRFGNRVWWFDGCGSADLMSKEGTIAYGTGRLYVQGAPQYELAARCNIFNIPDTELAERRTAEEGTALLSEGEWAMIDETEQVSYSQILRTIRDRPLLTLAFPVPTILFVAERKGFQRGQTAGLPDEIRVCHSWGDSAA